MVFIQSWSKKGYLSNLLLVVIHSSVVEVGIWGVSVVESVDSVEVESVVSVECVVVVLRVRFSLALENMVVHVVIWVGRVSSSIVCIRIGRMNPGVVCVRVGRINPGVVCARVGRINPSVVRWISLVIGAIEKCGVRFCFRFSFCFTFVEMMRIWVSVVNSGGMSICVRAVNSGVMDIVDIWTVHMCLFSILMSLQAKVVVFGSGNRYSVTRRCLQMRSYIPVVRNPL